MKEPNILQRGIDLLAENNLDEAEAFFSGFIGSDADTAASALTYLGAAALCRDDTNAAFSFGRRARRLAPGSPDASFLTALAYKALGDNDNALKWCRKTLDLDYNYFEGHRLMADISMPGPNYHEVLSYVQGYLLPDNYLEVGVRFGDSIELVREGTKAFGIDPEPEISRPLKSNIKIFEMTSDDFFSSGTLEKDLDGKALQLAFIDGMHSFEFAFRDFINIESSSDRQTVVMIHDCYPLDEITSLSERMTLFWAGDIWKIIVCLKKYRPDLKINVIKTYPTGIGVVTGLNPLNKVLQENYEKIVSEFEDFDFNYLSRKKDQKLNAVDNSWDMIKDLLDARLL
jgi:tetratricopeptide (TPR) repeat protein